MLVVVDKPLIQYAVEEAYAAGIREMIFVTGRNKRAIEDHFDTAYELETELAASGKESLIALINAIKPDDMKCIYIRQSKALGLGHAVLCAESLVQRQPFALILADDLMMGESPVLKQMTELFMQQQCSILAVQSIPWEQTHRYGIVEGEAFASDLVKVTSLIEKPATEVAPSNVAVAGRYILTPAVFQFIKNNQYQAAGEIQITDAISALIAYEPVLAYHYHGKRYDCGSKLGLLQANVDFGKRHPDVGCEFASWLASQ